jgi:predicted RNA-binding protein associated with RNAse of E/G family
VEEMPKIYRIRYIPPETIDLSSDKLLYRDNKYLITKWIPIKPRNDIKSGISCVFLEKGWKISAFFGQDNEIIYWYCDIVDINFDKKADIYYLYDLLTDIKIMPDGRVEIIDLDELAIAFENNLITREQLIMSLKQSSSLLDLIYTHNFPECIRKIINRLTGIGL